MAETIYLSTRALLSLRMQIFVSLEVSVAVIMLRLALASPRP